MEAVKEFKELVTDGTVKLLLAKQLLVQNLNTWENNFRGLADHVLDNGLQFENETEKALVVARNALLKEKAKVEAELQAFATEQQQKAEAAALAAQQAVNPPALDAAAEDAHVVQAGESIQAPGVEGDLPEGTEINGLPQEIDEIALRKELATPEAAAPEATPEAAAPEQAAEQTDPVQS